ncbi:dynamin-like GTPase OPA1, mitochondrial [Maniola hyperantus]|uniref:dynamin-like GTPase OPA1, mitochondrial n=1 Tax=Aphantopus hyperantus TaxID=2795564 RepID=UPI00374A6E13
MALKLKYTDEHGILHIDMSPSSSPVGSDQPTDPKFDTINNRFGNYDLFGGKYDDKEQYDDTEETQSLFRSRYNSFEAEFANTPYAFATDRHKPLLDITIDSRTDVSPSKDIENNRFFDRTDLFGPKIDLKTSDAFTVTHLIHAQDRYFDLSTRVGEKGVVRTIADSFEVRSAPSSARGSKSVKTSDGEAFKVLSADSVKGFRGTEAKVPAVSTSKRKRETSFAIIAEPSPSRPSSPHSLPVEIRPGRVSPFKGRGFKEETSRHNTPKTSAANSRSNSPPRRTNSLTRLDNMAQVATLPPPGPVHRPPRDFLKENREEIRELSELNREKNEAEAEKQRREEEIALLKEMGVLKSRTNSRTNSRSNSPGRLNLRSRSNSPSAILHFENIARNSSEFLNKEEAVPRPVTHRSRVRSLSKSQPQSINGSPKNSKIPKRQNSVSPTRSSKRPDNKTLNGSQKFMSNSTSSINETIRIGSQMHDKRTTQSSQQLNVSQPNVKGKPPISPGRSGPPPSNKSINSKRLSPIVGTPNKSPVDDLKPGSAKTNSKPTTTARKSLKTAGSTPAASRLNSRQISRTTSRDASPDKRNPPTKTTKPAVGVTKPPVTKAAQKPPISSKTEPKKPVSRTNSVKNLTRVPSTKNLNDKPPLSRQVSKKELSAKSKSTTKLNEIASKTDKSGKTVTKADETKKNAEVQVKGKEVTTADANFGDELSTQDNGTQYDKTKNDDMVILTKKNIMSMTTAAITSQPLEVVATVTNQLPSVLEKAREKNMLERLSSKESLVGKEEDKVTKEAAEEKSTMSRILNHRMRASLKKPSWSPIDKRAVAFSIYTGRSLLLHKPIPPNHIPRRKYGMLVARAVRGMLKIRYLILGGAVGGGMTLNKKYAEWKDGLPDMGWLNELLPDNDQWDKFTTTLISAKDKIGDQLQIGVPLTLSVTSDPRLRDAGLARAAELREWLAQRYEDAVAAAAVNNTTSDMEPAPKIVNNLQSKPAPATASSRSPGEEAAAYEKRIHSLQEEVLSLQARYQRELQRLEQENRELRQQNMLLRQGRQPPTKKMKRSLIDMYSAVLDELAGWEAGEAGRLPRVVVVGDQSAGKTSVLEMIAQARIFPRGAGEMCTRAPVKVTLSEGPYHVAQFRDSSREFDLNKESDLADLRKEVEMRMRNSVRGGRTVSTEVIAMSVRGPGLPRMVLVDLPGVISVSLRMRNSVRGGRTVSTEVIAMSVRGPGLPRMVLVDLPGVISTQTVDMAADTREAIKQMTKQYMDNPNAIILCIQDGSVDAERSNVTDLVASCDPQGKRTIFVLTKVDLAEENLANPNRIRRILEGKLFPMKALGYYAVVTGRSRKDDSIQSIREYEERFFRSSKLFKEGLVSAAQVTTRNLAMGVADCFWRMVRDTVEQQADAFKAMRFNLETEWKNTFPRQRELDRDELFERARAELLDQSAELSAVPAAVWEQRLHNALWASTAEKIFSGIYLPSAAQAHDDVDKFNTAVDIKLREWAESELARQSIEAGREALREEFAELLERSTETDPVYEPVKKAAVEEALSRHQWEERAQDVLRVLQVNALQDRCVRSRAEWDAAVALMDTALRERLQAVETDLKTLTGPSFRDRWLRWQYTSEEQSRRAEVRAELEKLGTNRPALSYDEIVAVRDNLRRRGVEVDNEYIRETWRPVYLRNFLQRAQARARDCKKSFYLYSQQNGQEKDCCEVVMFWRVQAALRTTANALRQQIANREAARLDRDLREVLDEMSADPELKKNLLSGRRVELAEELKRVRQVQEKLEEFIEALNKEK